ncbi:MAG: efflux RND transporter periplasmic adaptor subunit [Planctomycetales bacterium]|nr:efflux RND transporter periplasmic adaptor subunit [Planctomycetales bacterium]
MSESQVVSVEVAKVELVNLQPKLDLVGVIIAIPERTAMVSPQLGGWVDKLAVVEGQMVKAGDLLVHLDDRVAHTDIERAQAVVAEKETALKRLKRGYLPQEIETARQDRDKAKAAVDGLKSEVAALDDLLKRREISPVIYESKAKQLTAAEAALASAEAHFKLFEQGTATELVDEAQSLLDVAKADLEHAQLLLKWCSITSPLDGTVVSLLAHQGQFFDRAVALATVIDQSELFVQLRIPSSRFADVVIGTTVEVRLDSLPDKVFQGTVTRISGQADPMTGNMTVFATIDNRNHCLRPGLNCRASLSLPEVHDALAIPVAAIGDKAGAPVVTVIRDGKAYETQVEIGTETTKYVQITHGLTAGETVAISGGYGLPDGCPVTIVTNIP